MADSITTTPFDLFMARVHQHLERLKAVDDPLDVDVAVVVELRKFLNTEASGCPQTHPSARRSDVQDGRIPFT